MLLKGYIIKTDGKNLIVSGINKNAWNNLDESYWAKGICRRVSKDRATCTIRITIKTVCKKRGVIAMPADMVGCYVKINVKAKKYEFLSGNDSVSVVRGWTLTAVDLDTTKCV